MQILNSNPAIQFIDWRKFQCTQQNAKREEKIYNEEQKERDWGTLICKRDIFNINT